MQQFLFLALLSSRLIAGNFEAYGDSLTAGFMSGTSLTKPPTIQEVSNILSDFGMFFLTKDPEYVEPHHRKDIVWANLLYQSLPQRPQGYYNQAVSRSKTWQIPEQMSKAPSSVGSTAFLFIGHNDLCHSASSPKEVADLYEQQINEALEAWEARHSDSVLILLGIAEVHRLYPLLERYVWHRGEKDYSCNDSWDVLFPYCPRFHYAAQRGELEAELSTKISEMNSRLQKIARERSTSHNRFYYVPTTQGMELTPELFAIDCFHMSEMGQRLFSKTIGDRIRRVQIAVSKESP